jgi:hypothetical protein
LINNKRFAGDELMLQLEEIDRKGDIRGSRLVSLRFYLAHSRNRGGLLLLMSIATRYISL